MMEAIMYNTRNIALHVTYIKRLSFINILKIKCCKEWNNLHIYWVIGAESSKEDATSTIGGLF